ncbi:ankyrin repeat-containing domain protein [Fusarium flagelliforme]|uniref:ankyrin repeat-containing domain protein n=1 Tax=Fusarium flagelliforme TaxID=2675880 RepID=UPI001E8CD797|nr:ankyrin repeat-containing domain protein [Fusarium flagelliforme]KAH7183618.1 ankyrin repeat-containing domain protein [Fusarium flagelliforme]
MGPSLLSKAESPYRKFRHKPVNKYNVHGPPFDVPITLTDRDGTLIHEQEGQELLTTLIVHNDVKLLERYFAIDPRAIPYYFDLPDNDEAGYEYASLFIWAAQSGSLDVLQMLFNYTTKNLDPMTPRRFSGTELLNHAARFGRVNVVQWLLDNQPLYADIHDRDFQGYTALTAAANLFEFRYNAPAWDDICFDNSEVTMNLLLDHGACASDIGYPTNDKDRKAHSVLTLAAQWASSDLLARLIDGGADVHHTVAVAQWELPFLNRRDLPPRVAVEVDVNALFLASLYANLGGVRTLVDRRGGFGIEDVVCSPDCVGSLPVHWAARSPLEHIPASMRDEKAGCIRRTIEQLLDYAPTTINVQDKDGNTALHYATRHFGRNSRAFTPIFELLCSRGTDTSLRNYKDETPLHTLFQPEGDDGPIDITAVSLLLSHGAKVTDVDEAGNTPLHIATRDWHFIDAVALLLEYGADPAQKNLKQENALPKKMEYLLGSK